MYRYNPYINAKAELPLQAFVAPAGFNADAQELNIVKAYSAYSDANKKYVFSVGTTATTVLPVVAGRSYAYSENGGAYITISSGTITWIAGSNKRHVIVIDTNTTFTASVPASGVWLYCGINVNTLYSCNSVKYVHFQDISTLTTIMTSTFQSNTILTGVLSLPSSLTSIGSYGFYYCTGLTGTLTLPNSLSLINDYSFTGCSGFSGVSIPNSITSLGANSFGSCTGLTSISLPSNLVTVGASCFLGSTNISGTLTIPSTVTTISDDSFRNCIFSHLVSSSSNYPVSNEILYDVKVGGKVRAIFAASRFAGTISFRSDTTDICDYLFANNTYRTGSLVIPNTVTFMGTFVFDHCTGLTGTLTISSALATIGFVAFRACGFTGTLTIPSSVTRINDNAFEGCSGFTGNLVIPNTVLSMGAQVFDGCTGFRGTLTISSSFTAIQFVSFRSCLFTGTLNIPSSVATMAGYAFSYCTGFTAINSYRITPPTGLNSTTFEGINMTTRTLHVPVGSLAAYRAANYWKDFVNIIEDL